MDVTVPPLLKPNESLVHCPEEKAALFAVMFDSKQINDSFIIPQLSFPGAALTIFAFCSGKIKKLLPELDIFGGTGLDGIFLSLSKLIIISSKDFYSFP